MLGVKAYTREYVDTCRTRIDERLDQLAALKPGATTAAGFCADLALLLDYCFVHRLRMLEGKDGNALNEVRILCNSILNNGGVFVGEKGVKLAPEKSITGYKDGDAIALNEATFRKLSDAFFSEIEARFL